MKLATLCYIRSNGKTLMMHRVKNQGDMHFGKWNGLGGKLLPGESPEECVIREVREECGLELKHPTLKGFITFPAFDGWDDWYVFVFTAHDISGSLSDCAEGNLEWVPDGDLPGLDLWEGDYIFLPWLEGDRIFSAKFTYDQGRLTGHSVCFY